MPQLYKYPTQDGPRWGCQLKLKSADGKSRLRRWRGFQSKFDAERFLATKRDERYKAKYFPQDPKIYTVEAYFKKWLTTYVKPNCKYSTGHGYELILKRYLLPVLGDLRLDQLTGHHVTTLFTGLQQSGKSRQTLRNIIGPLREGLNHAVSDGLIPANPCLILQRHFKRAKRSQFKITPLTAKETTVLLAQAKLVDPILCAAVALGVRAGLRAGEVLGLQWGDVNPKEKTALIRHAIVRAKATTPKNHQIRTVDLTTQVVQALAAVPRGNSNEQVIRLSMSGLGKKFQALLLDADLPRIRFHDLRHSYASQLIQAGAHIKYIQGQLGHSSIKVTLDVYSHLLGTERDVDRLEMVIK